MNDRDDVNEELPIHPDYKSENVVPMPTMQDEFRCPDCDTEFTRTVREGW